MGIWWQAARSPQATARKVAEQFHYDRQRTRDNLAREIREHAAKRIAPLDQTRDWKKILDVEKERDQQLADLDKFLDGIEQITEKGEATESYLTATRLLQDPDKGIAEALAFLEAKSSQRASSIDAQKNRRDREDEELRKLLQEEMLAASLMEKQLRFRDAEDKYRKIVENAGAWAEPRNDLSWFLIQRGRAIEPKEGNPKLREAIETCRGTLALNPKDGAPEDWGKTQNYLGGGLQELGKRSEGEPGRGLLKEAITACRSTLEVFKKADLPQDWAMVRKNLGGALRDLGKRIGGEKGRIKLEEAVAAYRSALEVRTKAAMPKDWAVTQNLLAYALKALSDLMEGGEKLTKLDESIRLWRDLEAEQPGDEIRLRLANNLGGLAYNLVLNRQFQKAQAACEEAQRFAGEIGGGISKEDRDD